MKFGVKELAFDQSPPVVIVAEVGVNHNGDPRLAREMIDVAVHSQVDVVKFQAFNSEKEISRFAPKTPYQEESTSAQGNQLEMCKGLELDGEVLMEMQATCAERGVGFLCTAFDIDSVDTLVDRLGVEAMKVPSGEITNLPFLEYIGSRCRAVILSTGASTISETGLAIEALRKGGCEELVLLHCVTSYPASVAEVNLRAMETMRRAFGVPVGFSDHTQGISVAIAAAALGAAVIEKHFTLDRSMQGPDHRASVEPHDLTAMVHAIRDVEKALGRPTKAPQPGEMPNLALVRKGLVASRRLPAGTRLTEEMIQIKRPAYGIAPADATKVVGMVLTADVEEDAPIRWEDLR